MTDFEKAIRYICVFKTDDKDSMCGRYLVIEELLEDEAEIKKYAKKYDKLLDLLCS